LQHSLEKQLSIKFFFFFSFPLLNININKKKKEAIPFYLKVLEIRKKIYGEEHPKVATILNGLALLYKVFFLDYIYIYCWNNYFLTKKKKKKKKKKKIKNKKKK